MEKILFTAHTEQDGSLSKAALEALQATCDLVAGVADAELVVGLVGADVQAAADAIAGCGAQKTIAVTGDAFAASRYSTDAVAFAALAQAAGATLVVAPASSRCCRVMPGVALRLDGRIDTQITGLSCDGGEPAVQRWYYRQRMMATLKRTQRPWFLLIAAGIFEAWAGESGSATVEPVSADVPDDALRTEVLGVEAATDEAQTIRPEAELLFVAGAGWTKKQADGQTHTDDAASLILDFITKSQASLGSSKSLVDQGSEGATVLPFLSHLNQVGQTGATPRHPKGLATCCHGEEPHVVGWRFINERRAVNTDPNCGWARGKADVLYVADAFEVQAKINELMAQ